MTHECVFPIHSLFLMLALQIMGTGLEMQLSRILDLQSVKHIQLPAEGISALLGDGLALEIEDGNDSGKSWLGTGRSSLVYGQGPGSKVPRRRWGTFFSFAFSIPSHAHCGIRTCVSSAGAPPWNHSNSSLCLFSASLSKRTKALKEIRQ